MKTVLPLISIGKGVRIPCDLNTSPLKSFNTIGDEMRVGELRAFQHDKDIIHVVTPSSKTIQQMVLSRQPMFNMNVTKGGRCGS